MGLALKTPAAHTRPGTGRRRRRRGVLARRTAVDRALWALCALAALCVVVPVVSLLGSIVARAASSWRWDVLTGTTSGNGGGLANAIVGTLVLVVGVAVIAGMVGVAGGVFLAEFRPEGRGGLLRGASEVLSGIPSIVMGYVGYVTLVVAFHWGFSLGAALAVLSVLVVPYIVKSTEVALRQVPTSYREGGEALGMPATRVLRSLVLKPALPGIVTGLVVAVAIALGETAPLLYTAGWSDRFPTLQLTHAPIAYLPYAVYTFYNDPAASAHRLSAAAALVLVLLVLVLIVVARVLVALTQRHAPDGGGRPGRR